MLAVFLSELLQLIQKNKDYVTGSACMYAAQAAPIVARLRSKDWQPMIPQGNVIECFLVREESTPRMAVFSSFFIQLKRRSPCRY